MASGYEPEPQHPSVSTLSQQTQNPITKPNKLTNNPPAAQALPYIFHTVMGSPGSALSLTLLVLLITLFCSISITVAASRCTWAFARDAAIPFPKLFSKIHPTLNVPLPAIILTTLVQMLLGTINLGSTSAFTAFVSVGVQALAVSYAIPIAISLLNGRRDVSSAKWNCGGILGPVVNIVALIWIAFEVVLFSMPTALPVTIVTMNYASVVLVGFMALAGLWYFAFARKGMFFLSFFIFLRVIRREGIELTFQVVYKGPPESDGIAG